MTYCGLVAEPFQVMPYNWCRTSMDWVVQFTPSLLVRMTPLEPTAM